MGCGAEASRGQDQLAEKCPGLSEVETIGLKEWRTFSASC